MFRYNWENLTENSFKNFYDTFVCNNQNLIDKCIGQVRVGTICIDLIVREDNEKVWLSYDVYVGYCNCGYGCKNGVPYDYRDGGDFENIHMVINIFK